MNDSYKFQIDEVKKLSYNFYEKLAASEDALTYAFADDEKNTDVQVEVQAEKDKKSNALIITIDFYVDSRNFIHISDASEVLYLHKENKWEEYSS